MMEVIRFLMMGNMAEAVQGMGAIVMKKIMVIIAGALLLGVAIVLLYF